ncbi:MAG: ABC transporter ATP-binding protein [Bacteroidetes bacterium]|nr:ABC transporter ATP-binding protein [Bacteroidota bacterium]
MTTEPLFELTAVRKSFQREGREPLEVLKGIDLGVNRGEFLTIIGKSGSGKSTLLQLMAAFDKPTSGTIRFKDSPMQNWGDAQLSIYRNQSVGFIFQFHHLLPEFSAVENVRMPAVIGNRKITRELNQSVMDLLNLVGLTDRADHKPGQLSGGEQQRVAIARALINKPDVLFADEPTGNLDTANSEMVFNILETVHRQLGTTLLVVTHNQELAGRGTRQLELKDGNFV